MLAAKGYSVYATARRTESIADLEAAGCKTLALDVTSEESMQAAVRPRDAEGGIDALVNNAGIQESARSRACRWTACAALFETNVFGPVRLTQLVLPRHARGGAGT